MRKAPTGLICLLVLAPGSPAAAERLRFSGHDWSVVRGNARVEKLGGREALRCNTAVVQLEGVTLENGTIEFDLWTEGGRSFVGVGFRGSESGSDFDHFYVRPHNSGRFDAMQYTPVFHDVSAWQLYPEFNAAFAIPRHRWMHVKLRVVGRRLDVWLDRQSDPVLSVDHLRGRRSRGSVTLRAFLPGAGEQKEPGTAFADVTVHQETGAAPPAPRTAGEAPEGFIRSWSISDSFAGRIELEDVEARMASVGEWHVAAADERGRVNLAEHAAIPDGARWGSVLACVTLFAEDTSLVPLSFGFSDIGSIFLNRRPLFVGDNSYRSRSQRYLGVMTVDHEKVFLPLDRGRNELWIAVTESFGGWGLTARLPSDLPAKIRKEPCEAPPSPTAASRP